jgi:putative membrane protein
MRSKTWRYTGLGTAAALILSLSACKDRGQAGTASGNIDTRPADTGAAAVPLGADQSKPELTDANIVALLDEANMADSAAGAFALKKATNPEVKAFAKLMMGEHHALRAAGQQLAKKLNVTPQPPSDDPVKGLAESEMAALRAAAKGPAFDRTYIDQEVAAHKAVLDLAEKSHEAAQNEELKKLIEQAKPVIEKHLDMAQQIQEKLGKPSA